MSEPYDLAAQPKPIIEALMVHEALERLGFPSDSIFFGRQPIRAGVTDPLMVFVALRWNGRQFVVHCGAMEGFDDPQIVDLWLGVIAHQHEIDEAVDDLFGKSLVGQNLSSFIAALRLKGIEPPIASTLSSNTEKQ